MFKKISRFGRNLFKKQASGVNKIFSKIADGLDYISPSDNMDKFINSPIADALARATGQTGTLGMVRTGSKAVRGARDTAKIGAEVGSIYGDIADKGLTTDVALNTLERVSRLKIPQG
tara:strand:- start:1157 stop:1510 length:354 start_codon:yes stop_codon:yes gene_type:complete